MTNHCAVAARQHIDSEPGVQFDLDAGIELCRGGGRVN
jgi:hypothetical protein